MILLVTGSPGSTGQLITFVLGTIVIIILAYYMTYLVARGANRSAQSKAIKVLDRQALSKEKLVCLIEVADRVYLVAMTEGGVSLLATLDEEEARKARAEAGRILPAFSGVLQKGMAKGFSAVLEKARGGGRPADGQEPDLEATASLHIVQDEEKECLDDHLTQDDLDEMLRKIQHRREKKKSPPRGGNKS